MAEDKALELLRVNYRQLKEQRDRYRAINRERKETISWVQPVATPGFQPIPFSSSFLTSYLLVHGVSDLSVSTHIAHEEINRL